MSLWKNRTESRNHSGQVLMRFEKHPRIAGGVRKEARLCENSYAGIYTVGVR